jgi:hypothetical protein
MDMRVFYQKVKKAEEQISEPFVIIASLETAEGGQPGTLTEVSKKVAARWMVEGRARIASAEETREFRAAQLTALKEADLVESASRVQVTVVSDSELKAIKSVLREKRS